MTRHLRNLAASALLLSGSAWSMTPDLSSLESIPLALVRAPLAKAIEEAGSKSRPFRFAVRAPLASTLADGLWDQVSTEQWRWRMRVASPGAQSLNLEFAKFHLPPGAGLWIYDAQGEVVQGSYTSANETPEGKLWTAVVPGEQAVLEMRVPYALRDQAQLELAAVNHGFRGFDGTDTIAKSGSCNVDVVCPTGDDWRNQIRSVAAISIDGSFGCTGQMVNNTRQNNDPLFITANHCSIGQTGCGLLGTEICSPSSVVVYWNYYNSTCRNASGSSEREGNDNKIAQTQTGSSLLAGNASSDFSLIRLNQVPPLGYNVYYSGWNATNNVPQSGVAIHHPHGDEKSISVYNSAERGVTAISPTRTVQAWRVNWGQGTTQTGSSGGGLWDQNHLLVGWLSGGTAGCGPPTDQNSPQGDDYFGRMEIAWEGSSSSSQQLKAHLAPDGSDVKNLCGKNQSGGACDSSEIEDDRGGGLSWLLLAPMFLSLGLRRSKTGSPPARG
jgi:hypothetical protein